MFTLICWIEESNDNFLASLFCLGFFCLIKDAWDSVLVGEAHVRIIIGVGGIVLFEHVSWV